MLGGNPNFQSKTYPSNRAKTLRILVQTCRGKIKAELWDCGEDETSEVLLLSYSWISYMVSLMRLTVFPTSSDSWPHAADTWRDFELLDAPFRRRATCHSPPVSDIYANLAPISLHIIFLKIVQLSKDKTHFFSFSRQVTNIWEYLGCNTRFLFRRYAKFVVHQITSTWWWCTVIKSL